MIPDDPVAMIDGLWSDSAKQRKFVIEGANG
jgi:hypothetical protein